MELNIESIAYILKISLISISLILILIYIASKSLHYYPFYCNLLLLLIILLYNIFSIIIKNEEIFFIKIKDKFKTNICYTQAFLLFFLDKLLLTTLSMNSFLTYFGTAKMNFYKSHEKTFFFSFLLISIIISIFPPLLYLIKDSPKKIDELRVPAYGKYNRIVEFIFVSFLVCFNFYFILNVLLYISEKTKIFIIAGKNMNYYNSTFIMIISMFFLNGFLYLIRLLVINKKMFIDEKYFNIFFLSTCIIIEIFYCVNKRVFRSLVYVITCCREKKNNRNSKEKESDARFTLTGSDALYSDLNLSLSI